MTGSKLAETQLAHTAHHDELAGLADRRSFQERIDEHLVRASRYGWRGALLAINLDGLKDVNDAAGDELLRSAARRMCGALRGSDLLARFGGDEFVVLLPEANHDEAATVARKLVLLLSSTEEEGTPSAGSVGVAVIEGPVRSEQLFVSADRALYAAKHAGGNTFRIVPERKREPASAHSSTSGDQEPAPLILAS